MVIWTFEISKKRHGKLITEIGERYRPIQTEFKFIPKIFDFNASFKDLDGDEIRVTFEKIERNAYNVVYRYTDDNTKQSKIVPADHLLQILYTVIAAIKQFLKDKDPDRLEVFGDDKTNISGKDFKGQKNRIYLTIAAHNIDETKYKMSLAADKLYIEKRDYEAEDMAEKKLHEWFDYLVKRGIITK